MERRPYETGLYRSNQIELDFVMFKGVMLPLCLLVILAISGGDLLWTRLQSPSFAPEDIPEFTEVNLDDGNQIFVGRYEVTLRQWNVCVSDGGCPQLSNKTHSKPNYPITGVNWFDVQNYLVWYRSQTGTDVRLPSREEWIKLSRNHAPKKKTPLFTDPRLSWAANYDLTAGPRDQIVKRIGTFGTNEAGLSDIKGNVWEWTSTQCSDQQGKRLQNCRSGRFAMGEHEAVLSDIIRDPGNASCGAGIPPANLGFRLVYTST